jgi:cobalt/nickel transport system ATP-binding protein
METGSQAIISLRGITFAYPGRRPVLDSLDFELYRGERIGLVAPNGSGKTTLFHVIMGLLTPSAGTLETFGRALRTARDFETVRQRIGLLFQDPDDQLFSPTVLEDVAFGPLNLGKSKAEAVAISRRILNFLGLGGFEDRITFKLSGGEKRLVSLASVLAMEPEVLLLDEPTNGLDDRTRGVLSGVLTELDLSYVLISHNPDFLAATTRKIFSMANGKILTDEQLQFHTPLHAHPHGEVPHRHECP